MHRISIHTPGLATYATTTTALATDVATLTPRAASAAPELLAPTFGLIGTDFLAAYTATHATHVADLLELSAAFANIGTATEEAASTYADHDAQYTTELRATDEELRA
ncbi:type VII secretion target [Nocardia sp. NPDC059240]|uniref:type VII secretion target n=1 Tax=Nocardia sp. NPDC059240 TaxID=3346786 RepID=UPI0036826A8F